MKAQNLILYAAAFLILGVSGLYAQGPARRDFSPNSHPQAPVLYEAPAPAPHFYREPAPAPRPILRGQPAPPPAPAPNPAPEPAPNRSFLTLCLPFLTLGICK